MQEQNEQLPPKGLMLGKRGKNELSERLER